MKRFVVLFLLILIVALSSGCAVVPVGKFDVANFSYYLEWYKNGYPLAERGLTSDSSVGPLPDAATAIAKAEEILVKIYGSDDIKGQKPLQVSYDEKNGLWLVEGKLPEGWIGPVRSIILRKDDGKILAIMDGN